MPDGQDSLRELALPADPTNVVYYAEVHSGTIERSQREELPPSTFSTEPFEEKEAEKEVPEPRVRETIHPRLRQWAEERPEDDTEVVLINFRDDLTIPRFPDPVPEEPRDSSRNRAATSRADALAGRIETYRSEDYDRLRRQLEDRYGAEVLETYWLIRGMLVRISLGAVRALAEEDEVLYIQPRYAGEEPPQNTNANDDVDDGRARIVSDPYFNLNLTGGFIGLLDTGLRFSHVQFNQPSTIAFRRDCVNGGSDCNSGTNLNPNDDCWNHGTSTAAIITGNARQGAAFRGVTAITLDSFKVYPTSFSGGACDGGLDSAAAVRGFENAVRLLDRVIVAEMQGDGDDLDAISVAADNAFDAGAVIIAANGNKGPGASSVKVPAVAHRVIGVGDFDVQTQVQVASQSRGPAPDNRFKPDIQAPTNTETASNASDTAFKLFGGTSGATPYAAGAAALLRNWLGRFGGTTDPGQVYAQLILSGQQPYPFNNTSGAGPLRLPTDGLLWWGNVVITNGATVNIPLNIGNANTLDGALWWPESVSRFLGIRIEQHNDIDLHLLDPGGNLRDSSISVPSVFERARVSGSIAPGTWTLRIRGYRVETSSQTVYWAAFVQ
jgi:subtilisin family serine protease